MLIRVDLPEVDSLRSLPPSRAVKIGESDTRRSDVLAFGGKGNDGGDGWSGSCT